MVSLTLNEHILQGNTGRVLEAITSTEAFLSRQDIDFPRIAVFGDESTGKSSMLESICRIPFPRGETTTTRCPTLLRMQRKPGATWSATAWAGHDHGKRKNETHIHDPEDVTAVISGLQSTLIREGSNFSADPVTVSIEAEDAVDLTLVDLPGYFTHEGLDGAQNLGDVVRVKESLLTYLRDDNTIVLVVVPANQLVKTVNIFNLLKGYERDISVADRAKLHARTIYCFTKCDLVGGGPGSQEAPHDIEEILSNRGSFAAKPHGWYAVVNNGGGASPGADFMNRMSRDREYEEGFFAQKSPYNKSDLQSRCSTLNLVQKLSRVRILFFQSLLAEKISQKVPTMLLQTDSALHRANKDLKELGAPPPEERNLSSECRTIVEDIKEYYVQATEGIYGRLKDEAEDLADDIPQEDLEKCKLAYIKKELFESFAEAIKEARTPLNNDVYLAELQVKAEEAVNGKFEATMPIPEVLFEEVRICAKKWHYLAEGMCNNVAAAASKCLGVLVLVKASKYENLPGRLKKYLTDMIQEQQKKAQNRLDWHYVDEIVRPNTLNELFEKEINAMKNLPGLGKNKDSNRDAYICNLKAYLPIAEARYIDNAVRTVTTHILDVPRGNRMTRVISETAPKYSFQAPEICDEEDKEQLMKIRGDLSAKREDVEAKVRELNKLAEALRAMPAAKNVPLDENIRAEDMVSSNSSHAPEATNEVSQEEAKLIESVEIESPSFMERFSKLDTDNRRRPY